MIYIPLYEDIHKGLLLFLEQEPFTGRTVADFVFS